MSWFNPLSDSGTHHQKTDFLFFACLCWVFVMLHEPSLVGACGLLSLQSTGSLSLGLGVVMHELGCPVAHGISRTRHCLLHWQADSQLSGPPVKSAGVDFWFELISPIGQKSWTDRAGKTTSIYYHVQTTNVASLVAQSGKNRRRICLQCGRPGCISREDPLEKGMTAHPSILVWRIPWTEEPGRLQSMGSQRAWHDWAPDTSTGYQQLMSYSLFFTDSFFLKVIEILVEILWRQSVQKLKTSRVWSCWWIDSFLELLVNSNYLLWLRDSSFCNIEIILPFFFILQVCATSFETHKNAIKLKVYSFK